MHADNAQRIAVVEIGSRAVRLLVADVSGNKVTPVKPDYRAHGLGAAIGGMMSSRIEAAVTELNEIVLRFRDAAQSMSADRIEIVGTEALRQLAKKAPLEFRRLAPAPTVLSARTEAIGSMVAAVQSLYAESADQFTLVIDQGAGSVEVAVGAIKGQKFALPEYHSIDLGGNAAGNLYREERGDLSAISARIDERLGSVPRLGIDLQRTAILGSVATKIAWMKVRSVSQFERYDAQRVHGVRLNKSDVDGLISEARRNVASIRILIDPENPGGSEPDTVLGGAVVLSGLLRHCRIQGFEVCAVGMRFGLAWLISVGALARAKDRRPAI